MIMTDLNILKNLWEPNDSKALLKAFVGFD